jgi:hypothetical protein
MGTDRDDDLPAGWQRAIAEDIAFALSIQMAAERRGPPILRGKGAQREKVDEHRNAFALWAAKCLQASGFLILRRPMPASIESAPGFMSNLTPPCPACRAQHH